jgi:probable phosphoglycerate mutase
VPEGESLLGRFHIGLECLDEIAERHRGSTVVAVTHGGIVHGMFRHVTGVAFDALRRFAIRNAAFNVFLHDESGWSLETWGDISHYPAEIMEAAAFQIEKHTPEVP